MTVDARPTRLTLPTYLVGSPSPYPMFFEKRVYQGSSGKIYPLPFTDKVADTPVPVDYQAVVLENEFVYLELLPEIGGRIFKAQDKANAGYDFFYRQDVIKPALVGLAGPWISGGVEFNWPQHHRPGTFLPSDVWIEDEADGARTVWMAENDPLSRLRGVHGIRLRPGSAVIELRARLANRTPLAQTFLWWANVAAKVHDHYQSFFPPDVHYVADHAVRAMSSFPIAQNPYYGIDYAARPGANDLSWYRNIPVPTSYMVCETKEHFFGGYDHAARGGFIHVANRHIAPGKKQWTWGNHPFGWAWDRELTDENGPYVELMAGVYTDNQPDFSYLMPTEEKSFSQCWWPFQQVGPVQQANEDVAIRLTTNGQGQLDLGVAVSRRLPGARIELRCGDRLVLEERLDLAPGRPWTLRGVDHAGQVLADYALSVFDAQGQLLLRYQPAPEVAAVRNRQVATEPPAPADVASTDELNLIGEHLEQYRHPTRAPEPYWQEALRRDPGDHAAHLALGRRLLQRGQAREAVPHLQAAVDRLTSRHPNPSTGEAHYYLGLALRELGDLPAAYTALYKATWNYAWRAAAYLELACLDSRMGDTRRSREHAEQALETNQRNHLAHILLATLAQREGTVARARELVQTVLARDPLCPWARTALALITGDWAPLAALRNDAQTILDVAFFYQRAGLIPEALQVLDWHHATAPATAAVPTPLVLSPSTHYLAAELRGGVGEIPEADDAHPYFPSRLEELALLERVLTRNPADAQAAYGLGNLLGDRQRHREAIARWQQAVAHRPSLAAAWRNLGLAAWNLDRDGDAAEAAFAQALVARPDDARLIYEADQLAKKRGIAAQVREVTLRQHEAQVRSRDDASVEWASLLNQLGRPDEALALILSRRFHPWEGGEGKVLAQYKQAHLRLAEAALAAGQPAVALAHTGQALQPPPSLGETWHPLQNQADVLYWQGLSHRALGDETAARECLEACVAATADFEQMAVVPYSELSIYAGRALLALGRTDEARALGDAIRAYVQTTREHPATIDYFATSLPNLLVFDEDLTTARNQQLANLLALVERYLSRVG